LFLKKRNMTSSTKARAMIAPIMIPAIAPPDSFCFDEDDVDVFDEIEEEAPVGEAPVVMVEGAGVDNDGTEIAELDSSEPVVLTRRLEVSELDVDDAPSEPNAMSCWEV
jgi:hypothetical protein